MKTAYINFFNSVCLTDSVLVNSVIGSEHRLYPLLALMLFTSEGFLRYHSRAMSRGVGDVGSIIFHSYIRWLHKAGKKSLNAYFDKKDDGVLSSSLKDFTPKAVNPSFIEVIANGTLATEKNEFDSQIYMEAVLSASTAGLFFDDEVAFSIACEISYLTSGNTNIAYNSGFLALAVSFLKRGYAFEVSVEKAEKIASIFLPNSCVLKGIATSIDACKSTGLSISEYISNAYIKEEDSFYSAVIAGLLTSFLHKKLPLEVPHYGIEIGEAIKTIATDAAKISINSNFDYLDGEWLFKYPAW